MEALSPIFFAIVGPKGGLRGPAVGKESDSDCGSDGWSVGIFFEGKKTSVDKDCGFVDLIGSFVELYEEAAKVELGIGGARSLQAIFSKGIGELS